MSDIVVSPLKTLDRAVGALRELGLLPEAEAEQAPVVALIEQVAEFSEDKAVAIARTLSQISWFNEVVREEIRDVGIGERYESITKDFDSIREDAKRMVDQLADGEIDTGEKLSNIWMKWTRGTISDRFQDIKGTYLDVSSDTKDQIQRERRIIDAYKDFRGALKECQVLAYELLEIAGGHLESARETLQAAAVKLESPPEDPSERARLELDRDQKLRELQDTDKKYQIAKDLADNMTVSYNTTEIVMARLVQSTEVKERVYAQSVTFFGTNETVFTALNASFTSLQGLHESTQTLEAMKDGVNKSLETLSEVGDQVQTEGLKAGYGATIKAESVKKLVDAVVNYQASAARIIAEMRSEATRNADEIHRIVEDGKQRLIELRQHLPAA
ncbi:MAG: cell surface protein [Xanthomonadales bacterium]|nr:cell surface protein [Xanthomonadales bacterium]